MYEIELIDQGGNRYGWKINQIRTITLPSQGHGEGKMDINIRETVMNHGGYFEDREEAIKDAIITFDKDIR